MDLAYLEWLQGIRMSMPPSFEQFFLTLTNSIDSAVLIALVCIPYWCFDKRLGVKMLFNLSISAFICNFAKLLACVYRPWIRSDAIKPAEGALKGATGYSFPSGHSQMAASVFGYIAYYFKKAWVTILCVALILLTMLSRNILGVHTPQDVLIGALIGIGCIFLTDPLIKWADQAEGNDLKIVVGALAISLVTVVIVLVKPYPQDFDATGTLIVDPKAMQADYFKTVGLIIGSSLSWFLERRHVNFHTPEKPSAKVIALRIAISGALVGVFFAFTHVYLKSIGFNNNVRCFLEFFLVAINGVFLGPLLFTKVEKRLGW